MQNPQNQFPPRSSLVKGSRLRGWMLCALAGAALISTVQAQDVDTSTPVPLPAPGTLPAPTYTDEGLAPAPVAAPASTVTEGTLADVPPFDSSYLDGLITQGDWPEVERLTQSYHHSPTALRIAWHYFDQGDYINSGMWFDLALHWLREFPGDQQEAATVYPSAVHGKALTLFKDGRLEEAERYARQHVRVDDKIASLLADILIMRAGQLLADGEALQALNLMDEARPLRSAGFTAGEMLVEAWANYNLGWDNLQQFQRTKESYYKEVAQPYLDNAAGIFLKLFPLIDGMQDVAERDRTRASALEGLARTEYARGNYQEAYRIVNSPNFTGEAADKVRAEIRAGVLAAIYGELTPQQKLQYLEGLRQRTPLTPDQTLEHGMMYLELKQFSTAARIFEHLLNQSPPPEIAARAAMGLSFASNELQDYNRARTAAEQALRLRFYLESQTVGSLETMILSMDAQLAVAAYNAKDYSNALLMLERVRRTRPLNLGERSVEAWSLFHTAQEEQAFPRFESLYRDVREIRRRAVQWDPSLPEYLRPTNTYIPDTGPDPLPSTRMSVPVPAEGPTSAVGAQPYNYSYPGARQPYTAQPPAYYQVPAYPAQPPQQYQYQQNPYQQQVPPTYQAPPPAAPSFNTSPGTGPFGYSPPQHPQYDPRGRKHPLMQNLFDLPPGALPPSLDEAVAQSIAESGGEPPLPYQANAASAPWEREQESLFGQGDGEEPVVNERFARDFLRSEYGVGMPASGTTGPTSTTTTQSSYSTAPSAAAAQGNLPSLEALTGTPYPATGYSTNTTSGGVSPYINPTQAAGPGYYPTQTQPQPASQVNPQFDSLIDSLTQQDRAAGTTTTTTTTTLQSTAPAVPYILNPEQLPPPGQGTTNYTIVYAAPTEPAPAPSRLARPVIIEPDIALPGEPYVPKLANLAKGLFLTASRTNQMPQIRLMARELGGPLAAEVADGFRRRKLYLTVHNTFLASEPALENYDTGRLSAGVRMRSKSGTPGLGELDAIQFPIVTYEGYSPFRSRTTRFAAEANALFLDGGGGDGQAAFGRFVPNAPRPVRPPEPKRNEDNLVEARIRFWEEDWTSRFFEVGFSPFNGPLNATPTGRLGMTQQMDRGYWRADLFRESKKESVLSWVGEIDPVTGEAWGRVTETGISGEFLWGLRSDLPGAETLTNRNISVFGKGTLGFLSGEGVAENTHAGVTMAIQRSFESDMFDYLLGGIGFSAEHYEKNLSQYTYGHGGYFSPQSLLQAQLFVQFLTHEGFEHLISGQASVGFQTNRQESTPFFPLEPDGNVYPTERQTNPIAQANLSAAFLFDPHWKFTIQAGAAATPSYDEFFGGFLFTYYFEPRKGLYSSDLGTPFNQQ